MGFGEMIEMTLNSSFENSLKEVDIDKVQTQFNEVIEKSYRIDNSLIDLGLIYHINLDDKFNDEKVLRKMLDVLSEKYVRIRRESVNEKKNGNLNSTEENGYVYDAYERFAYISKIITNQDKAWILILTFNDQSKDKVKDFLDSIWIEKEKGVKLS